MALGTDGMDQPSLMILGDSFTVHWRNFPRQLDAALDARGYDVDVIAYSQGGNTSEHGFERLREYVEDGGAAPDHAILMLGINDALRNKSLEFLEDNLGGIIDLYQSVGTEVLLARPDYEYPLHPFDQGLTDPADQFAFDAVYDQLAASEGIPLEPRFTAGILDDPSLLESDTFHPNDAGVAVMVDNILPEVQALLGDAPPPVVDDEPASPPPPPPPAEPPVIEDGPEPLDGSDLSLVEGTIAMTVTTDSAAGRYGLFSKDAQGRGDGEVTLWQQDTDLRLRWEDEGRKYNMTTREGVIEPGEPTHIAFTFGGADGSVLYVDGERVARKKSFKGGMDGNDEPWILGANASRSDPGELNNLQDLFTGTIKGFTVFDQALSGAEIDTLAASSEWV